MKGGVWLGEWFSGRPEPGAGEEGAGVPVDEGGVAVGEVVLRSARAGVEVGGAGSGLADPAGVGLGRDGVAEVLEAVEDDHRAVLDAVLVPGDQAAADP